MKGCFLKHTIIWCVVRGGSKGGLEAATPIQKLGPLWPPNEVHHADILTEVYSIASLELQVQVLLVVNYAPYLLARPLHWPLPVLVFLYSPLCGADMSPRTRRTLR